MLLSGSRSSPLRAQERDNGVGVEWGGHPCPLCLLRLPSAHSCTKISADFLNFGGCGTVSFPLLFLFFRSVNLLVVKAGGWAAMGTPFKVKG